MEKRPIYIVVLVEYDYYRFQTNQYASTSINNCKLWILDYYEGNYPYKKYDEIDSFIENKLHEDGTNHLWIEKI